MLILTRKTGETIRIGDDIKVTILEDDRGSVRVGIDAPREVSVHREEVYQKIQAASVVQTAEVNGNQ